MRRLGHARPVTGSPASMVAKFMRLVAIPATLLVVGATLAAADPAQTARSAQAASAGQHAAINCEYSSLCAEVANPADVFCPEYVGHDEPYAVFYSNTPGSGNRTTHATRQSHSPS